MEFVFLKTKQEVINLISSLQYGSTFIGFSDEKNKVYFENYVNLTNTCKGIETIVLQDAIETTVEHGEYVYKKQPGVYQVIWKSRHEKPMLFSDPELNMENSALEAERDKKIVKISIRKSLYKYAKDIAKKHNIKSSTSDDFFVFSGKGSMVSAYKQIEAGLIEGLEKVELSTEDVNPGTVRVYASQFGSFGWGKLKVAVEGQKITVYLKQPGANDLFKKSFGDLVDKYRDTVPVDYMLEVIKNEFGINISAAAVTEEDPDWKVLGFKDESGYLEYRRRLQEDLDSWTPGQEDEDEGGAD